MLELREDNSAINFDWFLARMTEDMLDKDGAQALSLIRKAMRGDEEFYSRYKDFIFALYRNIGKEM